MRQKDELKVKKGSKVKNRHTLKVYVIEKFKPRSEFWCDRWMPYMLLRVAESPKPREVGKFEEYIGFFPVEHWEAVTY